MRIIFTICSNNYLAKALVLGNSIKTHQPNDVYIIVLVDEMIPEIDYHAIPFEVLPIHTIEPAVNELSEKYDIIELNTAVKPHVIQYFFNERGAEQVIYMDPDTRLYEYMSELDSALENHCIVLTPHVCSPIPIDSKTPDESTFLNYGIYNLGFVAVKKDQEAERFIEWWKERTYKLGYAHVAMGLFVDQLPINLAPVFFKKVCVLKHLGYNMAPWNLHERYLNEAANQFWVNTTEQLKFFHFSAFSVDSGRLEVPNYNRFSFKERQDLVKLYNDYNEELKQAGQYFYKDFICQYVKKRAALLQQRQQQKWSQTPLMKRMAIQAIRKLPMNVKGFFSRIAEIAKS